MHPAMPSLFRLSPAALLLIATPAQSTDTPQSTQDAPAVRALLDAAMKAGDEAAVNAIIKYAKAADKAAGEAMEQTAGAWKKQRREAAERKLREADFFELVKGRAELGGYLTSGNTDTLGLTGILDVKREALRWRHKVRVQADYQENGGLVARERYLAAYEPNFKFADRAYLYGAAQFESDRFQGYDQRYSTSLGIGYSAIKQPRMRLDLELGPAFRHTTFTDNSIESQLAARGKLDFNWQLGGGISFSQDAAAYVQSANSTITAKSALRARLFGPFSAQMSYAVNYESAPPVGRKTTDTTSRASLLIDF
jgi:putative salt-induced outer membrane protein